MCKMSLIHLRAKGWTPRNRIPFIDWYCHNYIKFHLRDANRKNIISFSHWCFIAVLKNGNISVCNLYIIPCVIMRNHENAWLYIMLKFPTSCMWVITPFGPDLLTVTPRNPCKWNKNEKMKKTFTVQPAYLPGL